MKIRNIALIVLAFVFCHGLAFAGGIASYTNKTTLEGVEELIFDDAGTTKNATIYNTTDNQYLSKSVAGGSDVNLTAAEAFNKRLNFTGTITADINVTIPDNTERLYVIENSTSGAFTLTFKTLSGTGIAVPSGDEVILSSDGTNVTNPLEYVIPVGSKVPFFQSACPAGWTQDTTAALDGSAIRLETGTGGGTGGTDDIATLEHTHADDLAAPAHTHTGPSHTHTGTTDASTSTVGYQAGASANTVTQIHTHDFTSDAGGTGNTGAASATALTGTVGNTSGLAPKYANFVVCTKD